VDLVETEKTYELLLKDEFALRRYISDLEIEALSRTQIDVPISHHFSKGVYAREMRLAAGSVVVGKIHKHENLCIISQGECSVISKDGVIRVKAPFTFVASAGAKRVILAHSDLVWTVIHGTDETDLEKIEDEFIAKTYDQVPGNEPLKLNKGE